MESAENREQTTQDNLPNQESSDFSTLSKVETLKLLNDSIDRLEETIKGISENSAGGLPSSDSINDLLATTQELAETVTPGTTSAEETVLVDNITNSKSEEFSKNSLNISNTSAETFDNAEKHQNTVGEQKPKQNKAVLISIGVFAIAMIVVAVFWIWFPTVNISESEEKIVDSEPSTEIVIPQDLIAPGRAKNLKIVTIEPELTFTPEQNLIAALQTKIANITEGYAADFIDLIKVNLGDNSILVEVNDNWYELNQSRQNNVTNAILERSRQLKFNHLKFQDSNGTLVARNPVVGKNIIILASVRENN